MSTTDHPARKLLSIDDVAKMLAVCPNTVRNLTDRGDLPSPIRLGRAVRYRLADVEAWIANGSEPAEGAENV